MKSSIRMIESECVNHFTRFNNLESFCSGGARKQTGEAIAMYLRNILSRVQQLEQSSTSSSSFARSSLGLNIVLPSSAIVDSKLSSLSVEILLIKTSVSDLSSQGGQDAIEIGGVYFQLFSQTIVWVRNHLPSNNYSFFQDVITLLDLIGTSNLTDNEFLDGQYKANRANFLNDSAARCADFFRRELPTLFGRVKLSSSDGQLASTHPLPSINNYKHFNAADNLSGVKQRVLSKMNTTISRINAKIG